MFLEVSQLHFAQFAFYILSPLNLSPLPFHASGSTSTCQLSWALKTKRDYLYIYVCVCETRMKTWNFLSTCDSYWFFVLPSLYLPIYPMCQIKSQNMWFLWSTFKRLSLSTFYHLYMPSCPGHFYATVSDGRVMPSLGARGNNPPSSHGYAMRKLMRQLLSHYILLHWHPHAPLYEANVIQRQILYCGVVLGKVQFHPANSPTLVQFCATFWAFWAPLG